jgi:transcriptional regulator with XRE-family HTH domain
MASNFTIKIDYKHLKEDILAYLRSLPPRLKSMEEMDELLELKIGTYESWEHSLVPLEWSDFCLALKKCGIEINFKGINGYSSQDIADFSKFLEFLSKGLTQEEFCQRVDISRASINRWLSKKAQPTVEMVFQILNNYRAYLFPFLNAHFPIEKFSSTEKLNEKMKLLHDVCFGERYGIHAIFYMLSDAFDKISGPPVERLQRAFKLDNESAKGLFEKIMQSGAVEQLKDGKFTPYLINIPIVFAPKSAQENFTRIQKNFDFYFSIIGRESIVSGHTRVFRRIEKVPENVYKECELIVRGAYQKVWHVVYNENLQDQEVEYNSSHPENERIAMMGMFAIEDFS